MKIIEYSAMESAALIRVSGAHYLNSNKAEDFNFSIGTEGPHKKAYGWAPD